MFPNRSIKGLENLTGEYGDRDIYGCVLADKQDFEVLCAHTVSKEAETIQM